MAVSMTLRALAIAARCATSAGAMLEAYKARAEWAEQELRRIHHEMAEAAIERRAELQREADAKAAAEAAAVEEKRLEECRRRAWMTYRVDKALAAGDPSAAIFDLLNRPSRPSSRS
jgi:hypothetical protein